ncbi:uncharacterized protein JCM15063_005457 [Sporobolomyces koalae]|uniref:uncharacterized protein n=1 Tax=Sporobolomyces koalae TaxID=500713 RepID=UPI00316F12BF
MSSSDSEEEATKRNLVPLASVDSRSLKRQSLVSGKISNITPYRNGHASFMLRDSNDSLTVRLTGGEWASDAIKQFNRIGKRITLRVRKATVEPVPDRNGNGDNLKAMFRLVYSNGIEGSWDEDGDQSSFAIKGNAPTQSERYSTQSTNPHARPSSSSTSKHQRALANLAQPSPKSQMTLDEEILAVPSTNPENPYRGVPRKANPVSDSEQSEDDDERLRPTPSAQSVEHEPRTFKKQKLENDQPREGKKKRVKRSTRIEWGMSSARSKLEYKPLSAYEDSGNCSKCNIIAIAVNQREIYATRNDYCADILLYDPTCTKAPIRFCHFGPRDALPVFENGDILIVQNINWQKDRKQFTGFSSLRNGKFVVIPSELATTYCEGQAATFVDKLKRCPQRVATVTEDELLYVRDIAKWSKKHDVVGHHVAPGEEPKPFNVVETSSRLSKGGTGRRELVEIRQLEPDSFYDVQGEIVKFYNREGRRTLEDNDSVQLFLTDYTRNDQMMRYEDNSDVPIPGQYTLQISVYGHQAQPLVRFRNEEELIGKVVFCRNVRAKKTEHGLLEATMYIDARWKDKSDVMFRSGKALEETEWYKKFKRRKQVYKASSIDDRLNRESLTTESLPTSTSNYDNPFGAIFDTIGLERQPMATIAAIGGLTGTFVFRARVLDYKPDTLENFVVAYCTTCRAPLLAGMSKCIDHDDEVSCMFQFALLLEGEPTTTSSSATLPRILVQVSGRQAASDALFPHLSAKQIFRDPVTQLPKLSQRLEPILGNLLSIKPRLTSNSTTTTISENDFGNWFDFVLEASRDGESASDRVTWTFCQERTRF